MSLDFLRESPERVFRKMEIDLRLHNPNIDLGRYKRMAAVELDEELNLLFGREDTIISEDAYGSWYSNPQYVELKMLQEAVAALRDYRADRESKEFLVPGFTYYRGVSVKNHIAEGEMCYFMGNDRPVNWVRFRDSLPLMKATELLRHGNVDDFKSIYVEMADGRSDSLVSVSLRHLIESSNDALLRIERYCDNRWDGPWPWETAAPYKLRKMIEVKETMKANTLHEMQAEIAELIRQINEGEAEKFEVVSSAKDIVDSIQKMIENLARIAGEGLIRLKDQARTALGDEAAMKIEHAATQPLNIAADTLSKLKVGIEQIVQELQNSPADNTGMNGGLGTPMDAMSGGMPGGAPGVDPMAGGDPMGGAPTDDLASVPPDGFDQPERAKKNA